MLQKAEQAFNFVSLLVEFPVISTLYFSILLGKDDAQSVTLAHGGYDFICVIPFISKKGFVLFAFQQRKHLLTIGSLTRR